MLQLYHVMTISEWKVLTKIRPLNILGESQVLNEEVVKMKGIDSAVVAYRYSSAEHPQKYCGHRLNIHSLTLINIKELTTKSPIPNLFSQFFCLLYNNYCTMFPPGCAIVSVESPVMYDCTSCRSSFSRGKVFQSIISISGVTRVAGEGGGPRAQPKEGEQKRKFGVNIA